MKNIADKLKELQLLAMSECECTEEQEREAYPIPCRICELRGEVEDIVLCIKNRYDEYIGGNDE